MRYTIIVGDNIEIDYADSKENARHRATVLAFKYKDETVVAFDTLTGSNAFSLRAPSNCSGCEDQ